MIHQSVQQGPSSIGPSVAMKPAVLKPKDIFALGVLAVASFPIVLLGVLLWTGNVRMVFGPESQDPNARSKLLERPEDIPGATKPADAHEQPAGLSADKSTGSEELDRREAELLREESRISALREDAAQIRDTIRMERKRLEAILGKGDSLQGERTAVLASTFSSMKPDAAAKILVALDDLLVTAILRKVSDDKPRAKLLAAVGKLDTQRAGRISRLLSTAAKSDPSGPAAPPVKSTEEAKAKDTATKAEKPAKTDSTSAKEHKP
jgi:flagellar motility protein MotE (MotC chaperone)